MPLREIGGGTACVAVRSLLVAGWSGSFGTVITRSMTFGADTFWVGLATKGVSGARGVVTYEDGLGGSKGFPAAISPSNLHSAFWKLDCTSF